jgi:serine/threonine protein kinase
MIIHEELLPPKKVLQGTQSDYMIEQVIGRGGMGAVYRVKRMADNSTWALKEMRPFANTPQEEIEENTRLFKQEVQLMRVLDHPNLLTIAESFEYDQRPMMVMEFVPGKTLEDRMRDMNVPMLEQQVIAYGIQLCRVLHYLHSQEPPIIYRDLKPPNIMIRPDGILKLIDFGVARTYKKRQSKDTIAMGSAGYAPPEQYGKGQTDARSDIYALGATMLHLLTNLPPVPLQPPKPGKIRELNHSVSETTEQVIIKAMSIHREERYRSCEEMEKYLHRCLTAPYVDPTVNLTTPAPLPADAQHNNQSSGGVVPPPARPQVPPAPLPPTSPPITPAPPVVPAAPTVAPPPVEPGSVVCAACGYVNKPGARFCANCGTPLTSQQVARLLVKSPRGTWQLKLERLPFRIGRRDPRRNHFPELDLAEHDKGIASRNHASIQLDGETYTLMDLGSTNGTLLNGTRVPAHVLQRLQQGDVIKIGEVEMVFHTKSG